MAINLSKGERVSLAKGLKNITVGLGWDPNEGTGAEFDLDASAFMVGSNGKIPQDGYFIFTTTSFLLMVLWKAPMMIEPVELLTVGMMKK